MSLGGPGLGGGGAGFAAAAAGFAAAASALGAGAVPASRMSIQRSTANVLEQTLASISELYLIIRREKLKLGNAPNQNRPDFCRLD